MCNGQLKTKQKCFQLTGELSTADVLSFYNHRPTAEARHSRC